MPCHIISLFFCFLVELEFYFVVLFNAVYIVIIIRIRSIIHDQCLCCGPALVQCVCVVYALRGSSGEGSGRSRSLPRVPPSHPLAVVSTARDREQICADHRKEHLKRSRMVQISAP